MNSTVCAVFDIDDTLYLEQDYVRSGFHSIGEWARSWLGIPDFGTRCWAKFQAGQRGSIFNAVLLECGLKPNPSLVSALIELYRSHRPDIALATDAAEMLSTIAGVVPIAVVTDGPAASQSRKCESLNLRQFADPIVLTDVYGEGFRKPHRRAFEYIVQCRPADRHLYVADNPLKDFKAPNALGWTTIRIRRPGGLHFHVDNQDSPAGYELPDCSSLPGIIRQMMHDMPLTALPCQQESVEKAEMGRTHD